VLRKFKLYFILYDKNNIIESDVTCDLKRNHVRK
jgi:hypothetical protein